MKRGWFGAALLLILLVLGVGSSVLMSQLHGPLSTELDRAAEYAQAENWDAATEVARQAQARWEKAWHISAVFADHGPMEAIDSLFAQLQVCGKSRDRANFAAICAALARQISAMGDAHGLTWWNLL